ncbi:EamA family transporter [bacterium BFN5]|nr:EamA family transporter [bacterium BFN5]
MSPLCTESQEKRLAPQIVVLMLVAVVVLWGMNVIMIKYLIHYFPPLALAGIRIGIAAAFLLPVSLWYYGPVIPPRSSWLPICGVAFLSIFLHQMALSWGITATSATHSVLILGLNPLLTTLLASWLVNESLSFAKVGGALSGLSGILLIVVHRVDGSLSSLQGDGIVFIATLTYVLGSLCVKKSTASVPPLMVTAYSHLLGAAGLLVMGMGLNTEWMYEGARATEPLVILLFSGLICTGLGTIWWNTGIHHIGASTAALFLNGQPIVGVFGSAIFLNEQLAWPHYTALVLVILGVSVGTGSMSKLVRLSPDRGIAKNL